MHECLDIHDENQGGNANLCRKTLSDCYKRLVTKLAEYADTYNSNFHQSSYDSANQCVSHCNVDSETGSCVKYDACCDDKNGHRKPFSTQGGRMQCCKDKVFDTWNNLMCF